MRVLGRIVEVLGSPCVAVGSMGAAFPVSTEARPAGPAERKAFVPSRTFPRAACDPFPFFPKRTRGETLPTDPDPRRTVPTPPPNGTW
jgi:hypothetical protein